MHISLANFAVKTILYILPTTILTIFLFIQCSNKKKEKIAQNNDNVQKECNEKEGDCRTMETRTCTVLATEETGLDVFHDKGNVNQILLDTMNTPPDETTGTGTGKETNGKQHAAQKTGNVKS